MEQNKWIVACIFYLMATAIPGGMGIMWGVVVCVIFAGGCFAKWMYEEDKYQKGIDKLETEWYNKVTKRK